MQGNLLFKVAALLGPIYDRNQTKVSKMSKELHRKTFVRSFDMKNRSVLYNFGKNDAKTQ